MLHLSTSLSRSSTWSVTRSRMRTKLPLQGSVPPSGITDAVPSLHSPRLFYDHIRNKFDVYRLPGRYIECNVALFALVNRNVTNSIFNCCMPFL